MMLYNDWPQILAPEIPWEGCYPVVERRVRAYLDATPWPENRSTAALVEALYPAQFAVGAGITARKRIFKALDALANHGLADCVSRGELRPIGRFKREGRPMLWHAPKAKAWEPTRDDLVWAVSLTADTPDFSKETHEHFLKIKEYCNGQTLRIKGGGNGDFRGD